MMNTALFCCIVVELFAESLVELFLSSFLSLFKFGLCCALGFFEFSSCGFLSCFKFSGCSCGGLIQSVAGDFSGIFCLGSTLLFNHFYIFLYGYCAICALGFLAATT